jgi:hypothetical protein
MDWKIEVGFLLTSPFLIMALAFGAFETVEIITQIRQERRHD